MEFNEYDRILADIIFWYSEEFSISPIKIKINRIVYNLLSSKTICHQRINKYSQLFQLAFIKIVPVEDSELSFVSNAEICPICGKHYINYSLSTADMILTAELCICGIVILAESQNNSHHNSNILRTSVPTVFQEAFRDGELEL